MNSRILTIILVVAMAAGTVLGAQATGVRPKAQGREIAPAPKVQLPSKDSVEYWIIRTQTMTEFIPFMTRKRTEFKETLELMKEFLVKIDKAQAFLDSGVKAPEDPKLYLEVLGMADRFARADIKAPEKPLEWDPSIEVAMKIIMIEGYLPTDVADDEEFETIKQLCAQKEKYGQKVRKELRDYVQKCLNIWYYLDTIDQQSAFREYKHLVEEQQRTEQEAARKERDAMRREQRLMEDEARRAWERERTEQRRQDMQARRYDVQPRVRGGVTRHRNYRFDYTYRNYRW